MKLLTYCKSEGLIIRRGFGGIPTFTFVDSSAKTNQRIAEKGQPEGCPKNGSNLISSEVLIYNRDQVIGIRNKSNDVGVVVEQVICPATGKNQKVILHLVGMDNLDV